MSATHDRILAYLRSQGNRGATDNEMSAELGIPLNTLRPRRLELERRGLIANAWACMRADSKVWVVLKEPKRPPRAPPSLAKALGPFTAAAADALERHPVAPRRDVVVIRISLGACRDLLKATET